MTRAQVAHTFAKFAQLCFALLDGLAGDTVYDVRAETSREVVERGHSPICSGQRTTKFRNQLLRPQVAFDHRDVLDEGNRTANDPAARIRFERSSATAWLIEVSGPSTRRAAS